MAETNPHDPGPDAAARRGEAHAGAAREALRIGDATVRVGTASWTDPTMTAPGVFEWTSPHGHHYRRDRDGTTRITPLSEPEPPERP